MSNLEFVPTTLPLSTYIEQFGELVERLAETRLQNAPEMPEIINHVEKLIEEYYWKVGKFPKPYHLEQLANYILVKDLKNKDVDKVSKTEYPILSDVQIKRRSRKQMVMQDETLDFLNTKYNKQIDSLAKKTAKKADY